MVHRGYSHAGSRQRRACSETCIRTFSSQPVPAAGASGTAVTFVDWDELTRWSHINQSLDLGFPEPQETYSSSDHLYVELGIPKGVKSSLSGATKSEPRETGGKRDKPAKVERVERPVRQKRERTRTRGAVKKERE